MLPQWAITEKWHLNFISHDFSCSGSTLWSAQLSYSTTKLSKHSNCTVISLKYLEENQEIHFLHQYQACLIHYFIWSTYHYYCTWFNVESRSDPDNLYRVSPTWPGQNLTKLTCMDDPNMFQPWLSCDFLIVLVGSNTYDGNSLAQVPSNVISCINIIESVSL